MEVYRQYRAFHLPDGWDEPDSDFQEKAGAPSRSSGTKRQSPDRLTNHGEPVVDNDGVAELLPPDEPESKGRRTSQPGHHAGTEVGGDSPDVASFTPISFSRQSATVVHEPPDDLSTMSPSLLKPAQPALDPSSSSATLPPRPASPSPAPSSPLKATWSPTADLDPLNPRNFSLAYKSFIVFQVTSLTLSMTYASSASASAEPGLKADFGLSDVGATASTSLFLIGMGIGAMPSAPLSELYGRFPVYLVTIAMAGLFECLAARATSGSQHLAMRFLGGLFSSAPLSNAGGTLNDIGTPLMRTIAFPLFATTGFVGPTLAPLFGGYLVNAPGYGWRWCFWICAAWHGANFVLVLLVMPETLGSMLLRMRAGRLSALTGRQWIVEPGPADKGSWWNQTRQALQRPFVMLVKEPILQLFTAYLVVVYIVLYGTFTAYPLIFSAHGLSSTQIGLTFIPVLVGFLLLLLVTLAHFRRYRRLYRLIKSADPLRSRSHQSSPADLSPSAHSASKRESADLEHVRGIHAGHIEPEERLVPLLCVNWLFPLGLFWLAFTSAPSFHLFIPLMSGVPFAVGLLGIFQGTMQYLIDAYGPFASSALAATTLVRYGLSGVIILAYPKMYQTLGNKWGTALFGFIGLALTVVPWGFYVYGRRVRARCKFTVNK